MKHLPVREYERSKEEFLFAIFAANGAGSMPLQWEAINNPIMYDADNSGQFNFV
jgi:hypothetical protein